MAAATKATASKAKTAPGEEDIAPQIQIDRIGLETLMVPIKSTSPLIVHNFSAKSKTQMLEAQQGKKKLKEVRDPDKEYEAAFYRTADGYGFPAVGFKAATVGAARFYDKSVSMAALRQFLFFKGIMSEADNQALIEIIGTPKMREDVVRLGGASRSADLRYRPEFSTWTATLRVDYVKSAISRNSVLSLIDAGGIGVGIGEWRPEHRGDFGCYQVDSDKEVEVINF